MQPNIFLTDIEKLLNKIELDVKTELSNYGDFGYPYYVDEEDTNLEALDHEIDINNAKNNYIKILEDWSNDRTCIPIQWIPLILRDLGIRVID